jgi:DNA uptake protein ComE-like DNA-binding protein
VPAQFCVMENSRLKWREAFTFTRSEQRGFRVLTILLLVIMAGRVCYFRLVAPAVIDFKIPAEWLAVDSLQLDESVAGRSASFDADLSDKHKGDRYAGYKPWSDSVPARSHAQPFKKSRVIELNTADTIDLRSLPSIGPWLARKIVEYRERLGGFRSVDQLLEVYRLTPGKLDTIMPFLAIDTSVVKRIDINAVQSEELMRHPYLSRSQARGLLAYRDKHGPFTVVVDLKKCLLIDEKTFEKLRDYLEVR